jgi:hypothetical protein
MTRVSARPFLAAVVVFLTAGPALAQSKDEAAGPPPVVHVPPAPGDKPLVSAAPAPTVVVPGQPAAPGAVVVQQQPSQVQMVPGLVLPPGSAIPPGMVQTGTVMVQPQRPAGNARVGRLQCDVSGGVSFVFGSTRNLSCEFRPANGPVERYVGEIRRFGVDIGVTGRGTMLWDVVSTGQNIGPGSLAGNYGGASSNVSAGVGVGSAVLVGGSGSQVTLQPLAIESSTGVNLAAGIAELSLRSAG